jgi:hypothetical protein
VDILRLARNFWLGGLVIAAASAAHADTTSAGPSPTRISVQGFGRGLSHSAMQALISRAVNSAEAESGSAGHRWSFVVQPGGDNRPTTLVVAALCDGEHPVVSGFYRTASLGTAPPIVFITEIQGLATRLILRERRNMS